MPGAIAGTLVAAHDADGAKADTSVGPDRPLVRGRRVDREAVVPPDVEQPPRDGPHRVGTQAAILAAAREDDVDRRVSVLRLGLFVRLDQADNRAVGLDRPDRDLVLGDLLAGVGGRIVRLPPRVDGRVGQDCEERGLIARLGRSKVDQAAVQRLDSDVDAAVGAQRLTTS